LRISYRQRAETYSIEQLKNRRVRAGAKRNREDGYRGKAGSPVQQSDRVAEIPKYPFK
jgi:hypothetical protein